MTVTRHESGARSLAAKRVAGVAVIAIATLAVYWPALDGGFIWDDDKWVSENPLLWTPDGLWRIWFSDDQPSQYFPLVYTSFRIEYSLWGADPTGYHVTNLLLHAVNALLVWWLLARLRLPGAWLAAAVFALHPVHVESVAWITERKNVLSTLFFLLSLLAWLRFVDARPRSASARGAYLSSLGLYSLALLSKTTACTLPAALVLAQWIKRVPFDRRRWLRIAPYVLLGAAMGLVTMWWERYQQGMRAEVLPLDAVERVLVAARGVWFYAGKLIWPVDLAFSYPKWNVDAGDPLQYAWPAACLLSAWLLWRWRERLGREIVAAIAFYVATLSPLLGFILLSTFIYTYVADHYQYVASIGPIALVSAAVTVARDRVRSGLRPALSVVVAIALAGLGWLTWRQAHVYESAESVWLDTLAKNPGSWLAHNNLGTALRASGRYDEAIRHFHEALRLERDLAGSAATIRYNLGNALRSRGDLEGAVEEYRRAIEAAPGYVLAHNNLGNALAALGRTDEAIERFREALRIRPDYAEGHYNLANALRASGRPERAIEHYRRAIEHRPDIARAHHFLGALLEAGQPDDALRHYREALRIDPGLAEAHADLAALLVSRGDVDRAVEHFREALRLRPDLPKALAGLAWVLGTHAAEDARAVREAVALAERAAEATRGRDPAVLYALATAYAAEGRHERALETARAALELATAAGAEALAAELRRFTALRSASPSGRVEARDGGPPSVVLITVDTLRADHLGCYGYDRNTSPNLDAFAGEGVLFRRFYAQASETEPAFASILSGFYPHETQIRRGGALSLDVTTVAEILKEHGYVTGAVVSNFILREVKQFNQGFDDYDDEMGDSELVRGVPERVAEKTTDAAIRWLGRHAGQPFFFWVHYQDPHGPYAPAPPHDRAFAPRAGDGRRLRVNPDVSGVGGIPSYQVLGDHREPAYYVSQYDGEIRYFDEHFGRLIRAIEDMGLHRGSLILFTSDHGEGMGERDYYFAHGEFLHRGLIHVPLIVRWQDRRGVRDEIAQQIDIAPTILAAVGIEPPRGWRGRNLLAETLRPGPVFSEQRLYRSLIRGDYNLVYSHETKRYSLYDLSRDPDQSEDLVEDRGLQRLVSAMREELHRLEREDFIRARPQDVEIDEETRRKLESLGYVR